MPNDLDPVRYDDLAEAGTCALRASPGAVVMEMERRTEFVIVRHMFLEMTIPQALGLQVALAEAISEAMVDGMLRTD